MIKEVKWFVKELLAREGAISAKRFWGGILLVNAVVLSYISPTLNELVTGFLIFGTGLLGLGLGEQIQKKGQGNVQ